MHLIKKLLSAVIPLSMVLSMPVMAREWAEIKSSGTIIAATDASREGEMVFRYLYQYLDCH